MWVNASTKVYLSLSTSLRINFTERLSKGLQKAVGHKAEQQKNYDTDLIHGNKKH